MQLESNSAPLPFSHHALGNLEAMERILAQELLQMPHKARERISEEVHGVLSLAVNEQQTPDFVPQKLAKLEHILMLRFGSNKSGALAKALALKSRYIYDYNFRLAFLRAELFDVEKTATRLNNYLEFVLELYGPNALMRPVTLADFSTEDLALLKEGAFQILPERDRAGRRIHGIFDVSGESYSQTSRSKVALYLNCACAEDEVTQQHGGVCILFQMDPSSQLCIKQEEFVGVQKLLSSAPLRVSSLHLCFPPLPIFRLIKAMAIESGGPQVRARSRCHIGSPIECQYNLQTFGIAAQNIPVNTNSGKVKIQNHLKWIGMRQAKEKWLVSFQELPITVSPINGNNLNSSANVIRAKDTMIECPNLQDVLLGRGKQIIHHPGNIIMRQLVALKIDAYLDLSRTNSQKLELISRTVVQIAQAGGRFLKEDPNHGWWFVVDDNAAQKKVRVYFRDLQRQAVARAKEQQMQQQQQPASTTSAASSLQAQGPHQIDVDSSTYGFCPGQQSSDVCSGRQCV